MGKCSELLTALSYSVNPSVNNDMMMMMMMMMMSPHILRHKAISFFLFDNVSRYRTSDLLLSVVQNRGLKQRRRQRQRQRRKSIGLMSKKNRSARAFLHLGTFLCRPLQNNNVK